MARAHVEFIQAQRLPWKKGAFNHLSPEVDAKILSCDLDDGSSTAILRFPAGWQQQGELALSADEEFFVIEGALNINGCTYGLDCYGYLPAGYRRTRAFTKHGATAIVFFSSEVRSLDLNITSSAEERDSAIPFLDTFEMSWNHDEMDAEYGESRMRWKILRQDAKTRDVTMLVSARAHFHPKNWRGPQEVHDCVEEMFLLSGDYLSDRGVMEAGAYFWRPPGLKHGPYGSRGGSLGLFRTLGAKLTNNWTTNIVELNKTPQYNPVILNNGALSEIKLWKRPVTY